MPGGMIKSDDKGSIWGAQGSPDVRRHTRRADGVVLALAHDAGGRGAGEGQRQEHPQAHEDRDDDAGLGHAQQVAPREHRLAQPRGLQVDGREGDRQQPADQADNGRRGHRRHVIGQLRLHLQQPATAIAPLWSVVDTFLGLYDHFPIAWVCLYSIML